MCCTFQLIDYGVLCGDINCKWPPSILITVLAFQRYRSFKLRNLRRRRRRHQSDSSSDMSEMSDESDLSEGQLVALTDCLLPVCISVCVPSWVSVSVFWLCLSSFLTVCLILCLQSQLCFPSQPFVCVFYPDLWSVSSILTVSLCLLSWLSVCACVFCPDCLCLCLLSWLSVFVSSVLTMSVSSIPTVCLFLCLPSQLCLPSWLCLCLPSWLTVSSIPTVCVFHPDCMCLLSWLCLPSWLSVSVSSILTVCLCLSSWMSVCVCVFHPNCLCLCLPSRLSVCVCVCHPNCLPWFPSDSTVMTLWGNNSVVVKWPLELCFQGGYTLVMSTVCS